METITRDQAAQLIDSTKGTIFKAIFRKRTEEEDGTRKFRRMICRKGVKKGVTGAGMSYAPRERELIPVYDMEKKGFRMISLEGLVSLKVRGEQYRVVEPKVEA